MHDGIGGTPAASCTHMAQPRQPAGPRARSACSHGWHTSRIGHPRACPAHALSNLQSSRRSVQCPGKYTSDAHDMILQILTREAHGPTGGTPGAWPLRWTPRPPRRTPPTAPRATAAPRRCARTLRARRAPRPAPRRPRPRWRRSRRRAARLRCAAPATSAASRLSGRRAILLCDFTPKPPTSLVCLLHKQCILAQRNAPSHYHIHAVAFLHRAGAETWCEARLASQHGTATAWQLAHNMLVRRRVESAPPCRRCSGRCAAPCG